MGASAGSSCTYGRSGGARRLDSRTAPRSSAGYYNLLSSFTSRQRPLMIPLPSNVPFALLIGCAAQQARKMASEGDHGFGASFELYARQSRRIDFRFWYN